MTFFLLKGLLRDRSRSLFPFLTVLAGVVLTVFLHAWLNGAMSTMIQSTAHFSTGHVRVMTRAYANEADQIPNDLALLGIDTLMTELRHDFPNLLWTPRIKFGGLMDVPDEKGETRTQAPISGLAVDLHSATSPEWNILNIRRAIVRGHEPRAQNEILVADGLAGKLGIRPGDTVTLIGSTMYGSMSVANFKVAGTIRFGVGAMDRATVIANISDIQQVVDMQQGAGEIVGFFADDLYHDELANALTAEFNAHHQGPELKSGGNESTFLPIMGTFRAQSGLSDYLDLVGIYSGLITGVFVAAMSIVLWNAGLTGSLRRYGEIGLRMAVGEDKNHIYSSMLIESLMIGFAGSVAGTALGLTMAFYLQVKGIDIEYLMKDSTMMLPNIVRAQITTFTFVIGFVPGLLATVLGTAISGIGIYKRQTSELFKELEA